MHRFGLKTVLVSLIAVLSLACSGQVKSPDVAAFWDNFRQAVIANDNKAVLEMVRFPFEVRGPTDGEPVHHLDRQQFLNIYAKLLAQPVYLPESGKVVPRTMRELIVARPDLDPSNLLTPAMVRFYQFEFTMIDGRWLFTRAYLEE